MVLRSVDIIHGGELATAGAGPEDKVADALLGPDIGAAELDQVPRQKGEASGSVSSGPLFVGLRLDNDSPSQDYYDRIPHHGTR